MGGEKDGAGRLVARLTAELALREKLAEYQELACFNTPLTKTQFGTMPVSQVRENTEAVAREVLPFFKVDEQSTKASAAE